MVANSLGHEVDIAALRRVAKLSGAGMTLQTLISCAGEIQLSARALRVELEDLRHLEVPAILHWNMDHFVVFAGFHRGRLRILDPARGELFISVSAASNHFTGIAVEFSPHIDLAPINSRHLFSLGQLIGSLSGAKRAMLTILGLTISIQAFSLVGPLSIQLIVDHVIPSGSVSILYAILAGLLIATLFSAILDYIRTWTVSSISIQFSAQLMSNFVRHLFSLPYDFFARRNIGDILSRIGSATIVQEFLTKSAVNIIVDSGLVLSLLILMFIYSAKVGAVFLFFSAITCAVSVLFQREMEQKSEDQIQARASEQTTLIESLRSIMTIKLLAQEDVREMVWRNRIQNVLNLSFSYQRLDAMQSAFHALISTTQLVFMIFVTIGEMESHSSVTLGMLTAFLSLRQIIQDRIGSLLGQAMQARLVTVHLRRIGEIVTAQAETRGTDRSTPIAGAISLSHVSFSYGRDEPWVLRDLDFTVTPGEYIGILGQSGVGKTTLLKVLTGLYEPAAGDVRIDGSVATPALWRWWREHLGIVSQDDRLLSGSIADNISFFDVNARQVDLELAASAAGIHDQIRHMPMGYRTEVGDLGSILSGGQRQRLFIARALYRKPKVIIMDEGTANLDLDSEATFGKYLRDISITRIIVSHRPKLLSLADRVYRLSEGKLELSPRGQFEN